MDTLFDKFCILKSHESSDVFSKYVDNIFQQNGNILSTYNFIRSNSITSNPDKIKYLLENTSKYINSKFSSINSVSSCLISLNDVNNKMLKIRMLFDYLKNRKSQDIFVDFLNIYFQIVLKNINIFVIYIFTPLVDKSVPEYILKQAEKSFNLLVQDLNYHFQSCNINKKFTDNEKKKAIEDSFLFYNKYGCEIIEEFGNVIQFYFESFKTQKFNNLVIDFKLAESMCKYETIISQHIQDIGGTDFEYKYKFKNLISKTSIIHIISKTNIFTCEPIFYDIIRSQLINNPNSDLSIYLEKLICCGLDTNIIVLKKKYASELLFLDIAKTFKILAKMLDCWSSIDSNIKIWIVQTINSILAQDNILINYLVTSMIIFVKKISINNFEVLKELVSNVSKCISVSNKESQFLDIFNQNLQTNLIKSKITEDLFVYISTIIDHFDPNESNYIKIKKFLYEIEINVCYNSEVSNVKVNCNKDVSVDMSLSNTILINKDVWKNKSKSPKIKIPDCILIYFKVYEEFYTKKHSFRSIKWCYENSTIDIQIGLTNISGPIIPLSILVTISSEDNGILESDLISKLDVESLDSIKKYLDQLELSEVIIIDKQKQNLYSINLNLPSMINLNKLSVSTQKQIKFDSNSFDIANTTDCLIIKSLKILNGSGLNLQDLTEKINSLNKYFKVDNIYVKTRIEFLEKKDYIVFKDSVYIYDP
jgi:hypothetical protein